MTEYLEWHQLITRHRGKKGGKLVSKGHPHRDLNIFSLQFYQMFHGTHTTFPRRNLVRAKCSHLPTQKSL